MAKPTESQSVSSFCSGRLEQRIGYHTSPPKCSEKLTTNKVLVLETLIKLSFYIINNVFAIQQIQILQEKVRKPQYFRLGVGMLITEIYV